MTTVRGFEFPAGLWYLVEQDTWVRREPGGLATVGITSLGAHISGDFIEFIARPVGTQVDRDRSIGALEMSKVIRSARTPVSGTIAEVNAKVRASPGLINADPYGEGWLARLEPAAWDEDVKLLATGDAVAAAVEAYMSTLVEAFGMEKPPA
ncbi:MAG TPA: glycine cleavage system protein H [Usitatibacter sp.]|nr:glycine cleavage system protein H [Usitatibacter sp.]